MGMISYVEELDRKCLLMYNTPTDFFTAGATSILT